MIRIDRPSRYVAELVLDRPEALNAVSGAMAEAISAAAAQLAADKTVRAVVLSSSNPKAFYVGADLKERNSLTDDELRAQRPVSRAAYQSIIALPMPAIAAVDGVALGGGFELALGCDLIVAAEQSLLGLPEVSVGVIPAGGGTQTLSRKIGLAKAADLIFTARRILAPEALALGAVNEVVPTGQARARALEIAEQIAANSPVGVRAAKRALRDGFDTSVSEGLILEDEGWHETAFSPDRAEGVRAFVEKRKPHFAP